MKTVLFFVLSIGYMIPTQEIANPVNVNLSYLISDSDYATIEQELIESAKMYSSLSLKNTKNGIVLSTKYDTPYRYSIELRSYKVVFKYKGIRSGRDTVSDIFFKLLQVYDG